MRTQISRSTLELVEGNIVDQDVDAIVNAANAALLGGGGVDGAIHRAAGPQLLDACRRIGGCPTGEARITSGYRLKARHIIHAVGPVYRGQAEDANLLASAYRSSLRLASQHGIKRIAFPAISTGAYGYPLQPAALIALSTVKTYLETHLEIELARFVLWGDEAYNVYKRATLKLLGGTASPERR